MSNVPYRGDTPSKIIARAFVWWMHQGLLGDTVFNQVPHIFLASKYAGDVKMLKHLGVQSHNIWPVDFDQRVYENLCERADEEGFCPFRDRVERLVEREAMKLTPLNSVHLDYKGTIEGTKKSTTRVVAKLPPKSAVSVALSCGREQGEVIDREAMLLSQLRAATKHPVTLVQEVKYTSSDVGVQGSAMCVWTFYIGNLPKIEVARFNLAAEDSYWRKNATGNREVDSGLDCWDLHKMAANLPQDTQGYDTATRWWDRLPDSVQYILDPRVSGCACKDTCTCNSLWNNPNPNHSIIKKEESKPMNTSNSTHTQSLDQVVKSYGETLVTNVLAGLNELPFSQVVALIQQAATQKAVPTPTGDCSIETLAKYARKAKRFSTGDVMSHFNVTPQKAAGSLAHLTRQKVLVRDGDKVDSNGRPIWRYSAKKAA